MFPPYKPHIPKDISEIRDQLAFMTIYSPLFVDTTGYFPSQNIDTVFFQLNEGLRLIRRKVGEERYLKLMEMSERMRAHFEADPENRTDDTLKGREIIYAMEDLLMQKAGKS
jgi:hypothetical protein